MASIRVYLETSFFRYLVARPSQNPLKAHRQRVTRKWWNAHRSQFELRVSQIVYEEFWMIAPGKVSEEELHERLLLLQKAALLSSDSAILELAGLLIEPLGPLPRKANADALHWAIAAAYECDYILTWNFRHLNNAQIKRRGERIIRDHGYESPTICSPDELP